MLRFFVSLIFWGFLLLVGATKIVDWTTDFWWFESLGAGEKWLAMMSWRAGAWVVGALLCLAVFGQNVRLALAHLRASDFGLLGGEFAFHGPPFRTLQKLAHGAVIITTALGATACANHFELWASLRFFKPIGQLDAVTGADLSTFLFVLPALSWAWNFFGVLLVLSLVAALVLYFYGELIEAGPQLLRVSGAVSRHLMVLVALLILWSGVRQGLEALGAPIQAGGSPSEIFGHTQAHFEVPARWFLLFLSVPIAFSVVTPRVLRLHNRLQLAGAWALLLVVMPIAIPASRGIGVFSPEKERQNIARHLATTRKNWGLEAPERALHVKGAQWQNMPNSRVLAFDAWSPEPLRQAFEKSDNSPGRSVARAHFAPGQAPIYRAVAQERGATALRPSVVLEALPSENGALKIVRRLPFPDLILSEQRPDAPRNEAFSAVPTTGAILARLNPRFREAATPDGAVSRDNWWRAALLAWRFWDRDLLAPGTAISWRLDPTERAATLFPFFDWQQSVAFPFLVETVRGPQLVWHIEGFSRSYYFPDSAALGGAGAWRGVNYLRPAISVLLDGHNGTVLEARFDSREPMARVFARAFESAPRLTAGLPHDLAPQNAAFALARAQIFARYKREENDTDTFADRARAWRVWNDFSENSPWPLAPDGSAFFAFPPAQGRAKTGDTTVINAILEIAPAGKVSDWRPQSPLSLPVISNRPEQQFPEGRPFTLPSVRFGLARDEKSAEFDFWRGALHPHNGWALSLRVERLSHKPLRVTDAPRANATLSQLWRDFKRARASGNWTLVEQRQREIDVILAPTPKQRETLAPTRLP